MTTRIEQTGTTVPQEGNRSVAIDSGQPWPSTYRGSRYSVVSHDDYEGDVLKWEHRDLSVFASVPNDLQQILSSLGKEDGRGSVRVTANREVLTKVHADRYVDVAAAPVDEGWIPVYVGRVEGALDFGEVETDPDPPGRDDVRVWRGFPFDNGERWSVSHDGSLVWRWRDYGFESAFDHPDIVATYRRFRDRPGRLYVSEDGHVWANVPNDDVAAGEEETVRTAVQRWKQRAEECGDSATLRLVNRRLVATSSGDDPSTGHLPVHLGHLSQFDGGAIPTPIVDEQSYFAAVCAYEQVFE